MMRAFFISISKLSWAQRVISQWKLAWRVASRFIAGETAAEAIAVVQRLNKEGILATVDHLGEHTEDEAAAEQAVQNILHILEEIGKTDLKANVSIKLSQFGLLLDPELCYRNLERVLTKARQVNTFVRVDMEDSSLVEDTLAAIYRAWDAGFHLLGAVIQSYLFRSEADIRTLLARDIPVRLVKGAYKEPPAVAFQKKKDVDLNFDRLSDMLISGSLQKGARPVSADGRFPPMTAIASHDVARIRFSEEAAASHGLPRQALEFQMLYGIRRDLQNELAARGYPVRVYVPYGTHWYPYFMRRLAERPANVWFFLSNLFQR